MTSDDSEDSITHGSQYETTSEQQRFSINNKEQLNQNNRVSIVPGTMLAQDSAIAKQVFDYINLNEFKKLNSYLAQLG